jgi:DNA-directed RNA polymerase beta' subunit
MQLKLANINALVENDKLKQVKTTRMFARNIQVDGLFSEEIFGKFGSNERKQKFAFVDLRTKIIHPEAYEHIFLGLTSEISKFLLNKEKYIIENGKLTADPVNGISGVFQFINNFDKINLDIVKDKKEEIRFIKQNLNKIFIDKWIILPAGIRDIQFQEGTSKSQIQYTELNELYENLIRNSNSMESIPSDDLKDTLTQGIQRSVLEINKWIKQRLKGKGGLIRGGLMRKVIDYSGRLVIITDNTLEIGEVGLPWQAVLRLFEPFAVHKIMKDKDYLTLIQDVLKSDVAVDSYALKNFIKKLNIKPSIAPPLLHDYFVDVARDIVKDKVVLVKRD